MASSNNADMSYDRAKEVRAFDDGKGGVKGLLDAGVTHIPKFFIEPPELRPNRHDVNTELQIPVIDLAGIDGDRRGDIVDQVRQASETWGFFQIVNHGVPISILDEMMEGVRKFNEQPTEEKMKFYGHDDNKKVNFSTNYDILRSKTTNWRDTLIVSFDLGPLDPEELPPICRSVQFAETLLEFVANILKMGDTMSELFSEALGLESNYLKNIDSVKRMQMAAHYYPACPEPDLTLGTKKHSDPSFVTILRQDNIGGLQVYYQNQWVNVASVPGALIVNIGDLFQLITNDRFKSVHHRVLANSVGPRISIACFLNPDRTDTRIYGPIKELLSDTNPPVYKDIIMADYWNYVFAKEFDENALNHFKI